MHRDRDAIPPAGAADRLNQSTYITMAELSAGKEAAYVHGL